MNTNTPWINLTSFTHAAPNGPIYSATWAAWIQLRDFSELIGFQWGFNARDLRQDAMERNLQFIKSLCTFRPSEDCWRRIYILRMYKYEDKLKFLIIVRNIAETPEHATNNALASWYQVRSTYPYDYILGPLSEHEYIGAVETQFVTVFYPCFRPLISTNNLAISAGFWSGTETSPELIWRTLSDLQYPVALEIYLQPTILLESELAALGAVKDSIQKEFKNLTQKEWLDAFSGRISALCQPYLLQLRAFSAQAIPFYVNAAIGSSFTFPPSSNSSYETLQPEPEQLLLWRKSVEEHKFIDCGTPLAVPPRLPYLATLQEVAKIFRAPFLPKGGIPDLKIDVVKQNA